MRTVCVCDVSRYRRKKNEGRLRRPLVNTVSEFWYCVVRSYFRYHSVRE